MRSVVVYHWTVLGVVVTAIGLLVLDWSEQAVVLVLRAFRCEKHPVPSGLPLRRRRAR